MALTPRLHVEARELPASPLGHSKAKVWDLKLDYLGGFAFRYKRPAASESHAERLRRQFSRKLCQGTTPDLAKHWIGRQEQVHGRLKALPILKVSRRWQPGIQVIREGLGSPEEQLHGHPSNQFRLILIGPASVYQHPATFSSTEEAEQMKHAAEREMKGGRDLVGFDWEVTDLFPSGRTIAYLPSLQILDIEPYRPGAAFRYNYFVSDADRFSEVRTLRHGAEVRITAVSTSYDGRLQWKVSSMEHILGTGAFS